MRRNLVNSLVSKRNLHLCMGDNATMAKDDLLLRLEMGKLEIEPDKTIIPKKEDNCFLKVSQNKYLFSRNNKNRCSCSIKKYNNNKMIISKKRNNKILHEPVLKLLQVNENVSNEEKVLCPKLRRCKISPDVLNLCALVDNCNQLRISSDLKKENAACKTEDTQGKHNWWKNELSFVNKFKKPSAENSQSGTCSQQALNPPCDVTIDELASYFETLVHIPKKMSSMAEMMYI